MLVSTAPMASGCGGIAGSEARAPVADKWLQRARDSFHVANVEDARDAVRKALSLAPDDEEVRLLAARIALARLDFDEALAQLKGLQAAEAAGLRGRAYWYKGELHLAADELERSLDDPDTVDPWAKSVAKLARLGEGRKPYSVSGALLAPVEMARVSPVAPYFVVPVEIDGEGALALVSTGTSEVVIDSSSRPEPSWVSLRFDKRLEVVDVPALSKDLSGLSKEMGAPIRALLGVNLLRKLNATVDYGGRQFVVRSFAPPPPPYATRVSLYYARGGGMVLSSVLGTSDQKRAALFVDSSQRFAIALDQGGWAKAGMDPNEFDLVPGDPEKRLRTGVVPVLKLGAFDLARVPGIYGAPIEDVEKGLSFDIDGIIGSPLLAQYRLTFADGGRLLWIEDDAAREQLLQGGAPPGALGPLPPGGPMAPPGLPPSNAVEGPAGPVVPAPPPAPAPGSP